MSAVEYYFANVLRIPVEWVEDADPRFTLSQMAALSLSRVKSSVDEIIRHQTDPSSARVLSDIITINEAAVRSKPFAELNCEKSVKAAAFTLGMVYPPLDVVSLSSDEILSAAALALSSPGAAFALSMERPPAKVAGIPTDEILTAAGEAVERDGVPSWLTILRMVDAQVDSSLASSLLGGTQ